MSVIIHYSRNLPLVSERNTVRLPSHQWDYQQNGDTEMEIVSSPIFVLLMPAPVPAVMVMGGEGGVTSPLQLQNNRLTSRCTGWRAWCWWTRCWWWWLVGWVGWLGWLVGLVGVDRTGAGITNYICWEDYLAPFLLKGEVAWIWKITGRLSREVCWEISQILVITGGF